MDILEFWGKASNQHVGDVRFHPAAYADTELDWTTSQRKTRTVTEQIQPINALLFSDMPGNTGRCRVAALMPGHKRDTD
jgi:hypothetical protein